MILIIGATGNLGGAIAHMLLSQGRAVRVLARPNSAYQPLKEAGAEVVFGDMKDRPSLEPVFSGIETVISTANSALRGGEDNIQSVDIVGNRNLVDAAKGAGVKHFIFVSALGAATTSPSPFLQAKGMTDEYLQASGLDYTILKPEIFMEVWPAFVVGMPLQQGLPVTLVGQGLRKHTFVSARDVAAYAVKAVDHPAAKNAILPVAGPEALTWREVVAVYQDVLGRPIQVNYVAPGEPVPGLPGEMPLMLAMMDTYDSVIDMTETGQPFGIQPTPLIKFVQSSMAG
jgi:NADH dehydrogenase